VDSFQPNKFMNKTIPKSGFISLAQAVHLHVRDSIAQTRCIISSSTFGYNLREWKQLHVAVETLTQIPLIWAICHRVCRFFLQEPPTLAKPLNLYVSVNNVIYFQTIPKYIFFQSEFQSLYRRGERKSSPLLPIYSSTLLISYQ